MRLKTLITSAFIAVAALTTQASAFDVFPQGQGRDQDPRRQELIVAQQNVIGVPPMFNPEANQRQPRHQPRVAPQHPIGVPPAFRQPPHQPPAYHQPRHQPRGFHQPRIVPQFIPVPQYIDREVYVEEPRYYAPQQQYYDDRPVYQPRRAQRRQVCRTVVARDKWGTRHYVKKCRPARRYR